MKRRDFIVGMSGFAGLAAAATIARARRAHAAADPAPPPRARACILLWLNGGPSHIDTWDPKPGTVAGGTFKAIPTRIDGVQLSEHLPRVADVAQHLAILRGMTSKEGNHDRAQHLVHTGYAPNPTVAYPSLGAWVAHEVGDPASDLPLFVSISGPSISAGFLGVQYNPFIVQNIKQPTQNTDYAPGVNMVRFLKRKQALESLEDDFAARTGDPKIKARGAVYARAIRMMYAPRLKAFDLADEPDSAMRAYGDSDFGRGCLMARRLVEGGVRFVEVVLDGWDTHKDNFGRTQKLMGALDPALAGLVADLAERKLLDSTLVMCMGEFGRTPRINGDDGRDHHPAAWSAVLAGGGIRGGTVVGATSEDGDKVVTRPVSVPDLMATAATQLGVDPQKSFATPLGRPITITDNGKPIREILG
ncbi:MAG TPA: DUF1501 domain-containing protein [Polyangia bacterium]|nr:DUF1501 domain-containing protein [Polyangia bacterium]